MAFSIIGILKSLVEFNIFRVHIDYVNCLEDFGRMVGHVIDHMPFMSLSGYFRIMSIALFVTYYNVFAAIPIGVFFLTNVAISYR